MRLPPLPEDQWDERTQAVLASFLPPHRLNLRGAGNALATFVRHPDLIETFLPFSGRLLINSTLPARVRELVILRVAHRTGCQYEWTHHVKIAAKVGLTESEIEAAGRGEATGELDSVVLTAVDELSDGFNMSDKTWAALGEHLEEHQLMDLIFTVGTYGLMAMAMNTFGVEPEQER
jgi:AhpD family alkylhydroperoxidase